MFDVIVVAVQEGCGTRVPVLALGDALTGAGARVEALTVDSDAELDEVLRRFDAPPRADGLSWPVTDGKTRLVVASAADGQLRAVLRRLVRRYAPPPRSRPDDLPAGRTVPDLPPIGVLPMGEGGIAQRLGLPTGPAQVAAALIEGRVRRLDLLRTDSGSVTLDGALFGTTDPHGRAARWRAHIEVDDSVLSDGNEDLLAGAIANGTAYSTVDGLPLVQPDPADGLVDVAVALPVLVRPGLIGRLSGKRDLRVEVRRARGRAVSVTPREEVSILDDGVASELDRKRSWWIERGVWAVYCS